jgi:hypothetical protein
MTFLYPLFEKGVSLFVGNPIGQSVWFIAMGIIFYAFSIKDDKKLVYVLSFSNIFWVIHFFLLGNIWAMLATIVAAIRLALSLRYKKNYMVLAGVALLSLILWFLSYESYLSLIPIVATILASYGFFFLEKIPLRIFLMITSVMWLYYHSQTGSIGGMMNETVVLGTLSITIYRFIFWEEKYHYDIETGEVIYTKKKRFSFRLSLKPKIKAHARLNFGRMVFLRDKDRFE